MEVVRSPGHTSTPLSRKLPTARCGWLSKMPMQAAGRFAAAADRQDARQKRALVDLIQILQKRIESLDEGPHSVGLRAVLQHVQVASNHLRRGVEAPDDTAFTDAIYRANQAFEGSLKEAYRVLARKDPEMVRPYDIENLLRAQADVRVRVLEQMSRYRTEWRNPSTHDYKLDFDEDEALLAIVSVCAFAVVLIDQIAERLSFDRAKAAATGPTAVPGTPLAELVANTLLKVDLHPIRAGTVIPRVREAEVVGAIAGRLVAILPSEAKVVMDALFGDERNGRHRADLIVELGSEKVLVEVKRTRFGPNSRGIAIHQLSRYIAVSGIRQAVLFMFDDGLSGFQREDQDLPGIGARIIILAPRKRVSA